MRLSCAQRLTKFAPILVLAAGFTVFFILGLDRYMSYEVLRENRLALTGFVEGHFGLSVLAYCMLYSISTALSLPGGALLTLTGGFLFGSVVGAAASVIGATIGASIVFLAVRVASAEMMRGRVVSGLQRMRAGFKENALYYLLFLRLVPLFPFFLVNLAPAFLNVRFSVYLVGTFFGIIPGTTVFALVGSGLGEILAHDETFSISSVFTTEIVLGLCGLSVLALLPAVYKHYRRWPDG